jgi:DNA-binding NtrC family response regulator
MGSKKTSVQPTSSSEHSPVAWSAVSAAFAALGRGFLCADPGFRVIHASALLDDVFGEGAVAAATGQPLDRLFGEDLFGPAGTLQVALAAGERREGWRATLATPGGRHLVSLTAAPFRHDPRAGCDPRVAYVLVVRPAEQDPNVSTAPTVVGRLIARSPAMLHIFSLMETLRDSEATILISGESGTGKELVARAMHDASPRHGGPFVAVNCGALPTELLESEMFGHARGAFTGAVRDRVGRFEAASNGTLFLDEVGDLPLSLQVKLLRALQDGTFERVGENETRRSRARIIAATHVDLQRAVREGRFRDDLYYRLRVVPIELPPLRERREDIEPLAAALLGRVGARYGRAVRLSPDALRALMQHDWPGNVRELENAIEFAVAVCPGQTILPEHLPNPAGAAQEAVVAEPPGASDLRRALEQHRWRRDATARALGISRITLWRRMRAAGLVPSDDPMNHRVSRG